MRSPLSSMVVRSTRCVSSTSTSWKGSLASSILATSSAGMPCAQVQP